MSSGSSSFPEGAAQTVEELSPPDKVGGPKTSQGSRVYFVRIPKTASSSFTELPARLFPPSEILFLSGEDPNPTESTLQDLLSHRFIHGHLPYSLVNFFPERPLVFTLLRDPIDRSLSAFHYMRQSAISRVKAAEEGTGAQIGARQCLQATRMTLREFIRTEPAAATLHLGNVQARLLSMTAAEIAQFNGRNADCTDLALAKKHLSECDAFGLVERLAESKQLLAFALGRTHLGELAWINKTRTRPPRDEIDGETREALEELTGIDRQLYVYARDLFEQRYHEMEGNLRRSYSRHSPPAVAPEPEVVPSLLHFNNPPSGEGWYAPEILDGRWFCWTGITPESSIHLGTPAGTRFELRLEVVHAAAPENLFEMIVAVNGVNVPIQISSGTFGHMVTASVEPALLRGLGQANQISLRSPRLVRPCECDSENDDSRLLGVSVQRAELLCVDSES